MKDYRVRWQIGKRVFELVIPALSPGRAELAGNRFAAAIQGATGQAREELGWVEATEVGE